jgi:hypothetical protein
VIRWLPNGRGFRYALTHVAETSDSGVRMTVEVQEKRFGVIAIQKGFVSKEQLLEALTIQVEEDLSGKPHTLIGNILMKLGYLSHGELDAILVTLL